ncbi:unnamed protein product [Didymodactylos carnosus]|uniref:Uncharacterized protein n=1 Tax=Didymodactylos carnosus TaxID=1234261 RepID=A0A8S2FWN5_9BILA|nr:unnamed protein product [Didymodactylos carnosus]CAF4355055.1 unnamed protein product [Didymodactylos carnosus]
MLSLYQSAVKQLSTPHFSFIRCLRIGTGSNTSKSQIWRGNMKYETESLSLLNLKLRQLQLKVLKSIDDFKSIKSDLEQLYGIKSERMNK